VLTERFNFFVKKPSTKAAETTLLAAFAFDHVTRPAPRTVEVHKRCGDDVVQDGSVEVYHVSQRVLTYLRDSPQALEYTVYYEFRGHGVYLLDQYPDMVKQARKERAA
jgi:hypothetical protein